MLRLFALLAALLVATFACPALAQRGVPRRVRVAGPAARAVTESFESGELGRRAVLHTVRPNEPRGSAVSHNRRRMLGRLPAEATYEGAAERDHRGALGRTVRGVRQRVRLFRSGAGTLRTRLSRRAAERHPALATALRTFPDAVVVGRTGTSRRGYVLHGPTVRAANGRREHLRVRVSREGRMETEIIDADTGLVATGTRSGLASRDWSAHPAVVRVDRAPEELYAVSDIHGSLDTFASMLAQWGVVGDATESPQWTAGDATLVVVGDVINKTTGGSLRTIDYLRRLERAASDAGGRVIVTMGNHEGAFLAEPHGRLAARATNIGPELRRAGYRSSDVARGRDADGRGAWLRNRPVAARVGRMLFVHSGDTNGRTVAELTAATETAIDQADYMDRTTNGEETDRNAPLSSEGWDSRPRVRENLEAADADGIVFGHDTMALGRTDEGGLASGYGGRLTSIDSAMRESGRPAMLRVTTQRGRTRAEALHANGTREVLWERTPRESGRD